MGWHLYLDIFGDLGHQLRHGIDVSKPGGSPPFISASAGNIGIACEASGNPFTLTMFICHFVSARMIWSYRESVYFESDCFDKCKESDVLEA